MKYIFLSLIACLFIACEQPSTNTEESPISKTEVNETEDSLEVTAPTFDPVKKLEKIQSLKSESELITEKKSGGGDCDILYQKYAQNKQPDNEASQDQITIITINCGDYGKEVKTLLTNKDNQPLLLHVIDKDIAEDSDKSYILMEYLVNFEGDNKVYMRSMPTDDANSLPDNLKFVLKPNPSFSIEEVLKEMELKD